MRPFETRPDSRIHFPENEGRTRQSFKDEADINKIMGKWRKQGFAENTTLNTPLYGDFTDDRSYQDALNSIQSAKDVFAALPARVRARVENDPGKLIAFVADENNHDELVELGLVNPISPEPAPTQVSPEAAVPEVDPNE